MWYIILILLNPAPGFATVTYLDRTHAYPTQALCMADRARVGYDMAEAYPADSEEFRIECKGPPAPPRNLRIEQDLE